MWRALTAVAFLTLGAVVPPPGSSPPRYWGVAQPTGIDVIDNWLWAVEAGLRAGLISHQAAPVVAHKALHCSMRRVVESRVRQPDGRYIRRHDVGRQRRIVL